MTVLTDTQVVTASGGLVELGYSQITSNVTITSNTAGSGTEIIAPLTVVCDGSPVLVEFWCGQTIIAATSQISLSLYRDGAEVHRQWAVTYNGSTTAADYPLMCASFRTTPSAGSHTFGVKAYGPSSPQMMATGTNNAPIFLRVSKIVQATQWPAVTTGTIICTSSTRPASPFAGQQIYETDTSKSLIYSGSVWQPPWNTAWGSVAAPATWGSNSITSTSTADTTLASVTFVAVAGRRYRTSWIFDTYCGAGYGATAKVKNGATLIASVAYAVGGASVNLNLDGGYVISGLSAGSCTINLTANSTTATLTYYGSVVPGQFAIEDVGPA